MLLLHFVVGRYEKNFNTQQHYDFSNISNILSNFWKEEEEIKNFTLFSVFAALHVKSL